MKKTLAIILTVAFVLSLGGAAFAQPSYTPQGSEGTYSSPATDTIVNKFNQTIDGWTAFYVTGHVMVEVAPTLYDERGWYPDSTSYADADNDHKSMLWADVTVYDIRPSDAATETYYGDVKVYNDIGESSTANPQGNMVGYAYFQTADLTGGGDDPTAVGSFDNQRVALELKALYEDSTIDPGSSPTAPVAVTNSLTVDHALTADASLDYKQLPDWHSVRDDDEMDDIYGWFEDQGYYATTTTLD